MKTFSDLWASYTARHPQLRKPDNVIKMTAEQLREALELAWNQGREADDRTDFSSIFGSLRK